MAITDSQKVDLLWKKVGFGKAKTDTNANKKAPNEGTNSDFIIKVDQIWAQSASIPGVIPTSNSSIVTVYSDALGKAHKLTEDATSSDNRTWTTGITNWIAPSFGATYQVKVYASSANDTDPQTSGTQLFETGSGNDDQWYFDYQSGVLNFIGDNLPNGVNFTGKSVYITGARYSGTFGVGTIGAQTNAFNQVDVYTSPSDASPDSITASSGDTLDIVADGSIQVTADVANKKITFSTANIPSDLTDLGITDGTNQQVLTTDGSGNFTFEDSLVTGTIPTHEVFTGDGTTINFTLSTTPVDVESIDVYVDNVIQRPGVSENFTLSGAVISTNGTMPVGSEMYVKHRSAHATAVSPLAGSVTNATLNLTYTSNQYTGNGSTTDFTIPSGHTRDSLLAIVGGTIYLPSQYSISGTTLSFNTAPGAGASVDFRYFPI